MLDAIRTTFKKLVSDKRGEDFSEKTVHISTAAKVGIAAACIMAAAAGGVAMANDSNSGATTVSKKINGAVGAQTEAVGAVKSPFGATQ